MLRHQQRPLALYQTKTHEGTTTSVVNFVQQQKLYQTKTHEGTTTASPNVGPEHVLYQTKTHEGTTTLAHVSLEL